MWPFADIKHRTATFRFKVRQLKWNLMSPIWRYFQDPGLDQILLFLLSYLIRGTYIFRGRITLNLKWASNRTLWKRENVKVLLLPGVSCMPLFNEPLAVFLWLMSKRGHCPSLPPLTKRGLEQVPCEWCLQWTRLAASSGHRDKPRAHTVFFPSFL